MAQYIRRLKCFVRGYSAHAGVSASFYEWRGVRHMARAGHEAAGGDTLGLQEKGEYRRAPDKGTPLSLHNDYAAGAFHTGTKAPGETRQRCAAN